jgi:hypothetical protein
MKDQSYTAIRAGDLDKYGDINAQVLLEVVRADLVVADLTGPNASVLYEMAFRHIARKPMIQLIEGRVNELPIYVRNIFTVLIEKDNYGPAKEKLTRMVQALPRDSLGPMPYLTPELLAAIGIGQGAGENARAQITGPAAQLRHIEISRGRLRRANELIDEALGLLQKVQRIRESAADSESSNVISTLLSQADSLEQVAQDVVASVQADLSGD